MTILQLSPGQLDINAVKDLDLYQTSIQLSQQYYQAIINSRNAIEHIIETDQTVYGVNTGFGSLANQKIANEELALLQKHLILSHSCGVGDYLDDNIVAIIMLLKINSLARGFSGVRLELIEALINLFNNNIFPCIPAKGSVGASGDLAPLSHLSAALLGIGKVSYYPNNNHISDKQLTNNKGLNTYTTTGNNSTDEIRIGKKNIKHKNVNTKTGNNTHPVIIDASQALKLAGLKPIELEAKEGLALINGTQVSTGIAIYNFFRAEKLFDKAIIAGAMSIDAAAGSIAPFDKRIHAIRGHETQGFVAKQIKYLLQGSEILANHKGCERVQDPYSLRCQAQVMGACLMQMEFVQSVLQTEANAVTDNPLVFDDAIISGGNFHAEPIAMVADNLALAIAEIGALSERRIALLIDKSFSELPAFLVPKPGLNSGFMIAHVTAASLASENKSLAHPASVDSLPTSANQEDHVSMATFAARRLGEMIDNSEHIIAIELLASAQGIDLRAPLKTSPALQDVHKQIRGKVDFFDEDRFFAPDIAAVKELMFE